MELTPDYEFEQDADDNEWDRKVIQMLYPGVF